MTLRLPRALSSHAGSRQAGSNQAGSNPAQAALDYEIAQEQANALGRLGRALEAALAALSDHDSTRLSAASDPRRAGETHQAANKTARARLVQQASEALWCFIVQREACGLRDPRPVLRHYGVPAEVQARMGVFGRR